LVGFVVRCALCACLLPGCAPIQPPAAPQAAPQPAPVLDAGNPVARLPVPADLVAAPPAVLEVPVERVDNPGLIPFSVAVFLEWSPPGGGSLRRAEVGRFAVHPPDRAGRFALDAAGVFSQVAADAAGVALLIELEPLRASQPLGDLRVHLGPVVWH
jgi:hypothetical protein